MSAKTSYVIRLSDDLYLDSNNNFLTGALPNLPVYALAGGDLPLSDDTRKALLHQILAVLPEDDPRWKTILRSIGIGAGLTEEVLHQTHRARSIIETIKACADSAGRRVAGPWEVARPRECSLRAKPD
ncbi:MAG TPA: hypothetical protein VIE89_24100 [Candidatus Binatia bacterium]|jgi:hypothetical protein